MQSPGPRTWTVDLELTESGWLFVPGGLHSEQLTQWVDDNTRELQQGWDERWNAKVQLMVEGILRDAALERDPQDVVAFLVWPVRAQLLTVRVHIGFADGVDITQLTERPGVSAVPIVSATLGPGVHISETGRVPEFGTALTQSLLIFQEETGSALVIAVDPTTVELFAATQPGLQDILDSIRARDSEGRDFRAIAPAGFVVDETAVWNFGSGEADSEQTGSGHPESSRS